MLLIRSKKGVLNEASCSISERASMLCDYSIAIGAVIRHVSGGPMLSQDSADNDLTTCKLKFSGVAKDWKFRPMKHAVAQGLYRPTHGLVRCCDRVTRDRVGS